MRIYIYGLYDPRDNELRYIGKTKKELGERLKEHIRAAKRYQYSPRCRWIKSLLDQNIIPLIQILDEVSNGAWEESEKRWIADARAEGINLTNIADGGQGHHDYVFTEEHRKKIGQAHKGNQVWIGKNHTEETKHKQSEAHKGEKNPNYNRIASEETREKMSKAQTGRKHSEETKRKMREARKKFYENPINCQKAVDAANERYAREKKP